ncbi:MAG: mechanosensitive ion channel family protein [Bacteroidota bacterium]
MRLFNPLLAILLFHVVCYSQNPDEEVDSVSRQLKSLNQQLESYSRIIKRNNQRRVEDSLARISLLAQIAQLKENDLYSQALLKQQIREIELRDSARNAARKFRILQLKEKTKGFVVQPFNDSLFTIYTKLGPVMPEERARNVEEKIKLLVRDDFYLADSLLLQEQEGTIDIMYQNLIVTSISDWDALWVENTSQQTVAQLYKEEIQNAILTARNRSSIKNFFARIGLAILLIVVVGLAVFFLNKLVKKGQLWMIRRKESYFTGIKLGNYEVLPPSRQLYVFNRLVVILKYAIFILLFYVSLPVLFSIFPFTKGWAETLLGWILSPAKAMAFSFWEFLPNLFSIVVIFVITRYIVRFLRFIASEIQVGHLELAGFHQDWAIPTFNIIRLFVYAFMLIFIWDYIPGSDSEVFKGVSVFLGVLFSLGSSSAIANAVAGLVITYMRPFRLGDRVKLGEITGVVVEKSLLVTRIRTTKNEDITVPNSSILNGHTVNYSSSSKELGLLLYTSVTIGYDVPWRQVHELLVEAAVATDGVNISREPFVLQTSLDDWYVSYQLNAYTDMPDQMPRIYSDLHANIQDKFNQAGVEIMSPHYKAVRDGNASTIPKSID